MAILRIDNSDFLKSPNEKSNISNSITTACKIFTHKQIPRYRYLFIRESTKDENDFKSGAYGLIRHNNHLGRMETIIITIRSRATGNA